MGGELIIRERGFGGGRRVFHEGKPDVDRWGADKGSIARKAKGGESDIGSTRIGRRTRRTGVQGGGSCDFWTRPPPMHHDTIDRECCPSRGELRIETTARAPVESLTTEPVTSERVAGT